MKKMKYTMNHFLYICTLMALLVGSSAYARQFDQQYLKWKEAQEAQDARLSIPRVSSPNQNYYLGKPALHAPAGVKISLNQANLEQLQELSGIGLKKAEAIMAYRQKNGKFKNIEQLQQVKGIGPALFAKNKDRLAL